MVIVQSNEQTQILVNLLTTKPQVPSSICNTVIAVQLCYTTLRTRTTEPSLQTHSGKGDDNQCPLRRNTSRGHCVNQCIISKYIDDGGDYDDNDDERMDFILVIQIPFCKLAVVTSHKKIPSLKNNETNRQRKEQLPGWRWQPCQNIITFRVIGLTTTCVMAQNQM